MEGQMSNKRNGRLPERVVTGLLAQYFQDNGFETASEEILPSGALADVIVRLPGDRMLLIEVRTGDPDHYLERFTTLGVLRNLKAGVNAKHAPAQMTEAVVTNMIVGERLAEFLEESGVRVVQIQSEHDDLGSKLAPLLAA